MQTPTQRMAQHLVSSDVIRNPLLSKHPVADLAGVKGPSGAGDLERVWKRVGAGTKPFKPVTTDDIARLASLPSRARVLGQCS